MCKSIESMVKRLSPLTVSARYRFVTFEDDSAVEKVFTTGTMHDISGKRVEVKTATPRGSGPVGRGAGPAGMLHPKT